MTAIPDQFALRWHHICNRLNHEMYDDISLSIKSIIDSTEHIDINDKINSKTSKKILKLLTKQNNLDKLQTLFIEQLIKKSREFTQIKMEQTKLNNTDGQKDINNKWKGLNMNRHIKNKHPDKISLTSNDDSMDELTSTSDAP